MIPQRLAAWVMRHQISFQAMQELAEIVGILPGAAPDPTGKDESWVQSNVRLDAARAGHWLGRNNVGALADKTGRFVRYGLANDSAKVNEVIKSADLIGIYKLKIEPEHVGTVVGQFWSIECKEPGWTYTGTPREVAQHNWAQFVTLNGGRASFTTGRGGL